MVDRAPARRPCRWLIGLLLVSGGGPAAFGAVHPSPAQAQETQQGEPPAPALQPIVRSIRIEGLSFYSESTVLEAIEQRVGEPLDREAMSRSTKRLYESYRIVVINWGIEELRDGIGLVIVVSESPVDFEPRFVGNDSVSTKTLLEWIGMPEEPVIYVSQGERIRQRIVEAYKRHGYHFAEVRLATRGEGTPGDSGPADIIYEIREGPKVRCTRVVVNGNDAIPDSGWGFWRGGLRSLAKMETKGRGPLSWWGKVFDEQVLQADLVALKEVYRQRGWLDVEADYRLAFNDERDRVHLFVTIDEGPLYRVGSVHVRAYDTDRIDDPAQLPQAEELVFPEPELLELCKMKPGVPFERGRLESDERALRTHYGESGYLDANFFERRRAADGSWVEPDGWKWLEPAVLVDYERKEIHLTYRVRQGRPRYVREVQVSGNAHTRDKVVRREVSVQPGQKANLKEIERSLGRIRGTGFFSDEVDPEHRDAMVLLHETDDPEQLDVEYRVEEGRVVDFQISGGVTSDNGLIGILSLGMRNFDASNTPDSFWSTFGEIYRKEAFHGNGELLLIDLSPGTQINSARLRYRYPDLFGTHYDRWALDVDARRFDRNYRSHDEQRTRLELELDRTFAFDHSIDVGVVWQDVTLDDFSDDDVLPDSLLASEGQSEFHGLIAGYNYYDLDNRINPRDGVHYRASTTVFGGALGGDEDLIKTELTWDWYDRIGDEDPDSVGPGIYLGLAGGAAFTYDDTEFVNYSERYFMGGAVTMRGFDFRGVGPFRDENGKLSDYAIGGETYLRGTAEYRFPLYTVPLPGTTSRREMFRGIFFLDWGVLGPDELELDFDETRASAGFAFGLAYPIPLTFNFGWPIRDGEGDDLEVFSFRLSFR